MPHDEFTLRRAKEARLKSLGISVRPDRAKKDDLLAAIRSSIESTSVRLAGDAATSPKTETYVAGRVVLMRSFGRIIFITLQDESGRMQIMFVRDAYALRSGDTLHGILSDSEGEITAHKILEKLVDLGDFIAVAGERVMTEKGEPTLFATEYTFLGKAYKPLPEKYHGISDDETRYRERHLEIISDESVASRFRMRSAMIRAIREFYWNEGFTEVETPVIGNAASGAAARPYSTHNNAMDLDVVLRISPECPLKTLSLSGMDKIFELGKAFRNEGQDPSHLPEHTHLEHYANYWNYEDNITFTERLFDHVFDALQLERKRQVLTKTGDLIDVDFTTPWEKVNYVDLIRQDSGIDIMSLGESADALRSAMAEKGIIVEGAENMGFTTLVDYLYKKVSRPKIVNPTFLVGYPLAMKPLARSSDRDPRLVDAFQLVINGWELVNAYSELVDPVDQAERFRIGDEAAAAGDEEAITSDREYVRAMESGMPPISGWGMGIDRLVAIIAQQSNLRDTIFFPLVRPRGEG